MFIILPRHDTENMCHVFSLACKVFKIFSNKNIAIKEGLLTPVFVAIRFILIVLCPAHTIIICCFLYFYKPYSVYVGEKQNVDAYRRLNYS